MKRISEVDDFEDEKSDVPKKENEKNGACMKYNAIR